MAGLHVYKLLVSFLLLSSVLCSCTQSIILEVRVSSYSISPQDKASMCSGTEFWLPFTCDIYFEICKANDCVSTQQNKTHSGSTSESNLGTRFTHTFTINKRTRCNEPLTIKMKSDDTSAFLSGTMTADSNNGSFVTLGNLSRITVFVDRRCGSNVESCEVKCINSYFERTDQPYKHTGISFDQLYYNISIMDSDKSGTHILTVQAHPEEENYNISCPLSFYGIIDGNDDNLFEINNSTGEITLAKDVGPFYSGKVLNITVKVTSIENPTFESEALVLIEIKENNCFVPFPNTKHCDNPESFMFPHDTIIVNVTEEAPTGTVVRKISVSRTVPVRTHIIVVGRSIKLRTKTFKNRTVAQNILTAQVLKGIWQSLRIHWTSAWHYVNFQHGSEAGCSGRMSALWLACNTNKTPCQELNTNVTYQILSGNSDRVFDLNRTSGVLSIVNTSNLDREVQSQYFLRIQALINGIADVIHVVVNIDDQNDNNPTFDSTSYTFSVYENVPYNTLIGTVKAVDGDADSSITYSFVRQSSTFTLDRTSGKIHLYRNLDSEEKSTYEHVVVATDSGANKRQAAVPVTINVLDVNDNKPIFNSSVYNVSIEAGENPRVLLHIHATDSDKNSTIKYYIETGPTNLFRLNQVTGELTTTKTITTPGIYKLKIAAYDGDPFLHGEITNYNYAKVNVIVHPSLPVVG